MQETSLKDTTHSYHPTTMPGKGLHAFITPDHEEAFAMMRANDYRDALTDLASYENVILEAVEKVSGLGATYQGLCKAMEKAWLALAGKG